METITLSKENATTIALMLSMHHRIYTDERERIEKIEDENEKLTATLNAYVGRWKRQRRIDIERHEYLKKAFREEALRMKKYRDSLKQKKTKMIKLFHILPIAFISGLTFVGAIKCFGFSRILLLFVTAFGIFTIIIIIKDKL